jgi:hypothetical protein
MLRLPAKASNAIINYAQLPANPPPSLAIRIRRIIPIGTDGTIEYLRNHPRPE